MPTGKTDRTAAGSAMAIRELQSALAVAPAGPTRAKLSKLGKLTVRHRAPTLHRIPLTGETKLVASTRNVKFMALGRLRKTKSGCVVHGK
jgi:nucleoid DNA-binding protein